MAVHLEISGRIALVTIDNPPVNAASQPVRAGLLAAIADTEADNAVQAVILRAAGRTFTAGADIREFGQTPQDPHLPDVIAAMERATKPWIAALHGTVLGGGLELALGCTWRVARSDASLGFPEVNLGLIPGAGGTVRLPRLVAPTIALDMIAGGKSVPAARAHDIGLIDRICADDVTGCAMALLDQIARQPRTATSLRAVKAIDDPKAWDDAVSRIRKRAKGANAPLAAITAVRNAVELPAAEAFRRERAAFLTLKDDPQSTALRYLFGAERSASKLPALANVAPPGALTHVGVVGGGTMGAGIAVACLLSGLRATMVERDDSACAAGRSRVIGILDNSRDRGLLTPEDHGEVQARFDAHATYAPLAAADLVIEAVFEDMAVKKDVFASLDRVVRADAILASNTSYLDVDEIAAATRNPSRVIGLHFFAPAHIMKLLEVVMPRAASATAMATGLALGKRLRKIAVPAGVCDGFIGNRIMSAYRRTCEEMVEDGALPWDVDRVMRDYGWPMGVFEMQDLAGLDISWAMRKRQAATRDPRKRYVDLGDRLCEAGRLGQKTGAGWYDHKDGRPIPSAWTEALLREASIAKGIARRALSDDEILQTILSMMTKEAEAVLAEGIARRPEDIDVVMVNGFGFPRWRGGPMFLKTRMG